MIDFQVAQAAFESAGKGTGILTPAVVTLVLIELGRLGQAGLKALSARRKNAEAKAGAGHVSVTVGGNVAAVGAGGESRGNGAQDKPMTQAERVMLHDHNRELGEHGAQIKNIADHFTLYHVENREDHRQIFRAIENLKVGK